MDEEKKEEEKVEEKPVEAAPKTEVKAGEQRYAGFWVRFLAAIIDGIVLSIVARLLGSNYASTILSWAYYVVMTTMYGATLGKMALGLKVIKEDGSQPDWGTAALREIVGKIVSAIILGIGFIMAGFDAKKQGLHDKIAKTYVVYK